eukprot:6192615-Pleurochrysis_carterae.AAC.3
MLVDLAAPSASAAPTRMPGAHATSPVRRSVLISSGSREDADVASSAARSSAAAPSAETATASVAASGRDGRTRRFRQPFASSNARTRWASAVGISSAPHAGSLTGSSNSTEVGATTDAEQPAVELIRAVHADAGKATGPSRGVPVDEVHSTNSFFSISIRSCVW